MYACGCNHYYSLLYNIVARICNSHIQKHSRTHSGHAHSPFGLSALINMLQAEQMKSLLLIFFLLFLLFLVVLLPTTADAVRTHTPTHIKLFSSYNKCNNFHVSSPSMRNVARSSGKYCVVRRAHHKFEWLMSC